MRNLLIVLVSVSIAVNIFTAVALMKHLEQCSMKSASKQQLAKPSIEYRQHSYSKSYVAQEKPKKYKKPDFSSMKDDIFSKENSETAIEMLENAAFEEDWKTVKAVADKMFALKDWQSNVPEEVQDALQTALSNFMPYSFPEMLGLLQSSYEDIREDVLDEIKQVIDDCDDQAEMANLIVKFSGAIDDEDFIDSMIIEIDMFEPENAATAMIGILKNGSSAFKRALANEIEEITDQKELSEKAILKWLEKEKADDQ